MNSDAHMLVIDDEESILFAVEDYFSRKGYVVDCARDRGEAEALLAAKRYGVVIADLRLRRIAPRPGARHGGAGDLDGLEIARAVLARDARTRVLIVTAYGSPDVEAQAYHCGVHRFLHKPQPLALLARHIVSDRTSPPAPALESPPAPPRFQRADTDGEAHS